METRVEIDMKLHEDWVSILREGKHQESMLVDMDKQIIKQVDYQLTRLLNEHSRKRQELKAIEYALGIKDKKMKKVQRKKARTLRLQI